MAIDKEVEKAVEVVVAEAGQPNTVARRLIAWLTEISERELTPEDQSRHLDLVRQAMRIHGQGE